MQFLQQHWLSITGGIGVLLLITGLLEQFRRKAPGKLLSTGILWLGNETLPRPRKIRLPGKVDNAQLTLKRDRALYLLRRIQENHSLNLSHAASLLYQWTREPLTTKGNLDDLIHTNGLRPLETLCETVEDPKLTRLAAWALLDWLGAVNRARYEIANTGAEHSRFLTSDSQDGVDSAFMAQVMRIKERLPDCWMVLGSCNVPVALHPHFGVLFASEVASINHGPEVVARRFRNELACA